MNQQKEDLKNKEEAAKTAPNSIEGANGGSAWKRLLSKKWVFPASYMAAAAIILTLMWVYQDARTSEQAIETKAALDSAKQTVTDNVLKDDALAVTVPAETMAWPFQNRDELEVALPFFDTNASNEVRQAAMVEYGDTFTPHMGIDYARPDNQTFDVLAAMSGTVSAVEKNPVIGNLVEITHSNGLVTVYQSLAEIKVAKDQQVKKGDMIAQAGRNELEKEYGVHLHFEVRQGQGGPAVTPEEYLAAH
jgi:stage II sporulation protein Q